MSTTLEREVIETVENEATQTDLSGDLWGGWRLGPAVGRGRCSRCKVARHLDVGRSTLVRAVASDGPPRYERSAVPTLVPCEPLVRQLLAKMQDVPSAMIAKRVGWTGSITWTAATFDGCGLSLLGST